MRRTRNDRPFYYCLYENDRVAEDSAVIGKGVSGRSQVGTNEELAHLLLDEYGNETGERALNYASPVLMYANISPASGSSQTEMFGNLENYDKVIVTRDMDCPIDENSVLFIDKEPEYTTTRTYIKTAITTVEDTVSVPAFDYIVRRVAKSLHHIAIAVRKVEVS